MDDDAPSSLSRGDDILIVARIDPPTVSTVRIFPLSNDMTSRWTGARRSHNSIFVSLGFGGSKWAGAIVGVALGDWTVMVGRRMGCGLLVVVLV